MLIVAFKLMDSKIVVCPSLETQTVLNRGSVLVDEPLEMFLGEVWRLGLSRSLRRRREGGWSAYLFAKYSENSDDG